MKKLLTLLLMFSIGLMSCLETSEGTKFGTVQKVSHKSGLCNYYCLEVAYEGGVVTGTDQNKAYSNTQEIEIDKAAYDTLQSYLGDRVLFEYRDVGFDRCVTKKLVSIRKK